MRMKSLKIGARVYRLVEVTTAELDDNARWAEIDRRRYCIRYQTWDRPGAAKAESILHEILHALFDDSGPAWAEEEAVITMLAPRLAAFLADNPDAVRELLRMLT